MSQKNLVKIQGLFIALLFVICVALVGLIINKYQSSQKSTQSTLKTEQNLSLANKKQESKEQAQNEADNPFEKIYYENIALKEQNLSTDLNLSSKDLFLANLEQNFTQEQVSLEQNLSFEENLTARQNLNFEENLKNQNSQENLENLTQESLAQGNLEQKVQDDLQGLNKEKATKIDLKKGGAKLAIIIDDMSNYKQVKSLKALNLKLIPSFFPPDKTHKNTHKLALQFDFYMVHLPLAAFNYKSKLDTLEPSDSEERIAKKITSLKENFKNLKYINNHTGSLFTSDEMAMRKLYVALQKQNFTFVDSKTIENSKVQKIAKEFKKPYIQRDVFLDNEDEVEAIKKQIQKAVNLAHKKGFAIAIAHPKKNTFKALAQSKNLLQSVKLVYLSEIYGE